MGDYKDLVDDLHNTHKVFYETFLNEESKSVESVVAYKAAKAIERLVKWRGVKEDNDVKTD